MQIPDIYKRFQAHYQVETDTRKIKQGDMFFALKGPHFNGNDYLQQALDAGAAYCISDEPGALQNERIIQVSDSLQCLQDLAAYHRSTFTIPIIAVTGSNGKTTTKELLHAVLSKKYRCHTTVGNLNNHIGIPLTLLRMPIDAEIAVIEMGANHLHEIEGYCQYTQPTHGLITNCGKAHLEGFGSIENIIKAKGELFRWLETHEGTAFVNRDYEYLLQAAARIPHIVYYGTTKGDYIGNIVDDHRHLTVQMTHGADLQIHTQLIGGYNLPNVLSAVAMGKFFGVDEDSIQQALEEYTPGNSRSQLIEKNGHSLILDAYNANPSSMKLAIENFSRMPGENKILILGAMKELGEDSEKEHAQIIDLIQQYNWKLVLLAGKDFAATDHPFLQFDDSAAITEWLLAHPQTKAQFLIKGSRSMEMEKTVSAIINY